MEYLNLIFLILILGYIKLLPWIHYPIVSVIYCRLLAQINSVILPIQSPDLIYFLLKCFHLSFFCLHFFTVHVVEPCLFPTQILVSFLQFCSMRICEPVFHNSSIFLPFLPKIMEWILCIIYPTWYFLP